MSTWPCDNCKNEYVPMCLYLLYWDSAETIDSEMQFPNNGQGSNGKFCWKGKKNPNCNFPFFVTFLAAGR